MRGMKTIFATSMRFLRANPFITLSSILSVCLSISLVLTMMLFAMNAKQTVKDEVTEMFGTMDLSVGYDTADSGFIDQDFLDRLTAMEGVKETSNVLISQLALSSFGGEAPTYSLGVGTDELVKSRYHFKKEVGEGEIIINESLAKALGVGVGDELTVEGKTLSLIETFKDNTGTGVVPDILILSYDDVKRFMDGNIEATYVLVKTAAGTDNLKLATQIKGLDEGLRVELAEENPYLTANLSSLSIFIYVLSFFVLIVTSLLIISNFETFLYKYKQQFAIMRSIGATAKQLFGIIFIQSSVITATGAFLGVGLAYLSQRYVQGFLQDWMGIAVARGDFHTGTVLWVTVACAFLIQLFLLIPAIKNGKTLPLKVMQENEELSFSTRGRRFIGRALLIMSIVVLVFGKLVAVDEENQVLSVLAAATIFTLSIFVLFPLYLSPILKKGAPFLQRVAGNASYVAIRNVIPQVKKNTFVILTVSMMMIIAVFGSVMLTTIQNNEALYLKSQFPTEVVLQSRLESTSLDPFKLKESVEEKMHGSEASFISTYTGAALMEGDSRLDVTVLRGDLDGMVKQGFIDESSSDEDGVIVSEPFARKHDLKAGDRLQLEAFSNDLEDYVPLKPLKVAAVEGELFDTDILLDWKDDTFSDAGFARMFVSGGDPGQLESLKGEFPELQVHSYGQSVKESNEMFQQRWSIFIIFLGVMLLSVTIGVFNTLLNNIHSKRKEFAILRTLSLTRKGIISVILTQVLLYILIGISLGIVVGAVISYIINIIDPGPLAIDYGIIGGIVLTMVVATLIIFTPLAYRIGGRKLTEELNE